MNGKIWDILAKIETKKKHTKKMNNNIDQQQESYRKWHYSINSFNQVNEKIMYKVNQQNDNNYHQIKHQTKGKLKHTKKKYENP